MSSVNDEEAARQRLKLMLRAERAMGAVGVRRPEMSVDASPATSTDATASRTPTLPVDSSAPSVVSVASVSSPVESPRPEAGASLAPALFAEAVPTDALGPNRPPFETEPQPTARKVELLLEMDTQEVKGCTKCALCATRTHTVFGEGDADAKLMFIGEGPGENEDLQGRPFVGRAGELLNKMIAGMGLRREQVFIANVVKCRPPNNRVPLPEEVARCTPYLERQIEIIRPRVIVTLGLPATQYMLQSKLAMGKLRGNWHAWRGIQLMPTYHPAYLLRNYTDAARAAVWSDLQQVMKALGLARTPKT
jgi:uracil-DNA glycosylase